MIPLLPFAAGLIAGGLAVRLLRDEKTQDTLRQAQESLRSAAQSGLSTLKASTAAMKERLSPAETTVPAAAAKPAVRRTKAGGTPRKAAARKAPARPAKAKGEAAAADTAAAPRKRARKTAAPQA
ncbi:MAG: hypothetical protein HYU78_03595 [Rhodocyclales bacterium]|nr:hypothetical protein [Rhodocyclales bacterium]